jgi:hypothetical protein
MTANSLTSTSSTQERPYNRHDCHLVQGKVNRNTPQKADRYIVSYPLYALLFANETGFLTYRLVFHHDRSDYPG